MDEQITLVGALVIAVGSLATVIGVAGRMLWTKLFAKDEGLLIIAFNKHLKFIDQTAEMMQVNTDSQKTVSMAMREISMAVKRTAEATENQERTNQQISEMLDHQHEELVAFSKRFPSTDDFSTVATNEAIHHLARAGRAHLDGKDDDCRRELDQAEKVVNGKT